MRSPLAPLDLTPFSALTHPVRVRPRLRNWSRTFGCAPEALFAPATAAEAQLVVREARRQSRRVRAVGEHNSPSECWASDDVRFSRCHVVDGADSDVQWIISTKHLRGHIIDAEKRIATLGSGLTLGDVHPLLDAHGLALPTSPSILEISIGVRLSGLCLLSVMLTGMQACFSGSEHGSGAHSEILAAAATHVVLLTSDGNLVTAERDGAHAALFAAAAAGLGLCGIVVEATFACVPAFRLSVRMEKMRLEDTLHDGPGGLLDVARSADMVKVCAFSRLACVC
jgi:FAD/FMN-containing dehydrogenase